MSYLDPLQQTWRHQPPLLCERELAARWRKSVRTLQRWRANRYGPAFLQIGGNVYYRIADILAFEERQVRGDGS